MANTGLVKLKLNEKGIVIIKLGKEETELNEEQINNLMEKLDTIKYDAREFESAQRSLTTIKSKYQIQDKE
jgi:translation elongation factor EF-1alpha